MFVNRAHGTPPTERVINTFLGRLTDDDRTAANHIADQVGAETPLPDTVCLLATAAHQESPEQIIHAAGVYAGQTATRAFAVVIGLNCPDAARDSASVADAVAAVETAKQQFPELDLRSSFISYPDDKPAIGKIRRDFTNGVLLRAQQDGTLSKGLHDVITIDHGVDVVDLSPRYVDALREYYAAGSKGYYRPAVGTVVQHADSPAHPNISLAVRLQDTMFHAKGSVYEAGVGIPASLYAVKGGYRQHSAWAEAINMLESEYPALSIPDAAVTTSPRRYHEYIALRGFNVWDKTTFHDEQTHRHDKERPDISSARLHDLLQSKIAAFPAVVYEQALQHIAMYSRDESEFVKLVADVDSVAENIRAILQESGMQDLQDTFAALSSQQAIDREITQAARNMQAIQMYQWLARRPLGALTSRPSAWRRLTSLRASAQ